MYTTVLKRLKKITAMYINYKHVTHQVSKITKCAEPFVTPLHRQEEEGVK